MGCVNSTVAANELNLDQPLDCRGCVAPQLTAPPPKHFHEEYALKAKLGKGAFAQVHLAHKVADGSAVAVKITDLRANHNNVAYEEVDARLKRTVQKEASILAKVGAAGKHCVRYIESYLEGSLSYIVMERCDMTLLHALERSPELTERTYLYFFRQMLQALDDIHKLGVVHRDVKPDNFLCVGRSNTVKLCDFGLAEVLSTSSSEVKGVYGTAPFMSPEMLGSAGYGTAADVWSFGVIAYVLFFGQFPYVPIDATAKAMKAAILSGLPVPPFKAKAGLDNGNFRPSPESMQALRAMLNRDKTSRLSAADALELPWLAEAKESSQWSMPSLRPMLCAAKRAGAFDVRGNIANEKPSGVDHLLRAAQARNMCSPAKESFEKAHLESSSNKAKNLVVRRHPSKDSQGHSDSSWEAAPMSKALHRNEKLDPTMVQSGGAQSSTSHLSTATGTSATSYHSKSSKHGQRSMAASPRDA